MLARRFALAVGLVLAVICSQVPEFVQQYRQRLGGTLDELRRAVGRFDDEARAQSLSREAGIARLRDNADPLVQARGSDIADAVDRERRLSAQQGAFETAGPLLRYWVFVDGLDPELAGRTYAIFEPAVPVTPSGLVAGGVGLAAGYAGLRGLAAPFRRRRRAGVAA